MKLFLTGGFLGAGKTTAIQNACAELKRQNIRSAVITNDQGTQLVDTEFIKKADVPVLEVTDGCFCCNYNKLDELIEVLQTTEQTEIIFAESVGSCTDLVATVLKPLKQFHQDIEVVISVFADARILPTMLQGSKLFVDSVNYIYKKQLEEADIIVVNKIDTLSEVERQKVKHLMTERFPDKTILLQNSYAQTSIENWLKTLIGFTSEDRKSLDIDYNVYGAGEAELAWLDAELEIYTEDSRASMAASAISNSIYLEIKAQKLPIGHLKFLIDNGVQQKKISFTSGNNDIDLLNDIKSVSGKVGIIINARVQTEPDHLKRLVVEIIQGLEPELGFKAVNVKYSAFKPGFPQPTHRILNENS